MLKKILLFLLAVLVIIQFFHPGRNRAEGSQPNNILKIHPVPAQVKTILDKACADCHSNNTVYPWYSKIQPVDWWLTNHINEGKDKLNFDEFENYNLRRQYHSLEDISKTVKENDMPLNSYTWIHADARLTEEEKNILISWADAIRTVMKGTYPADSLERKKR
ncbi:MAG: cytochrome [Chitinophagaceae bacterium]|nr:cytochrome [Chitinophagaceae bacterium]